MTDRDFKKTLKKILGFKPKNLDLYKRAFIHRSATYIDHTGKTINNERLEFLGDAILDAVVADLLFKKFPNATEGFLTEARSKLVNGKILSEIAQKLKLGQLLITFRYKYSQNQHICSDAVEALIGAVYLDKGYKKAYNFVVEKLLATIDIDKEIQTISNFKSEILEYCQQQHIPVVFETNLDDEKNKIFKTKLYIDNKLFGEGTGSSKKEAEQNASKKAYEKIKLLWQKQKK